VVEGPLRGQPGTWSTEFAAAATTRAVAVYVLAPRYGTTEAVAVDAVRVARVPVGALVADGGEFPRLDRLGGHGAARLSLDRDERVGLLALPGGRSAWRLPADERPRRLDFALGTAPRAGDLQGAVRVRVVADGTPVFEAVCRAPTGPEQPAWVDHVVDLPAGARTLELSAHGEGEDPPLVLVGHPSVRARVAAPARPNVVLISLDTLRPDRLGCYGGPPGLTPRLDALAAEGLRFANAYSTSSYTLPSHASMLSGQHPSRHGLVDRPGRLQRGRSPALAELLADAGFVTAAFTGGGFVGSAFGLDRGFDRFSHNDPVWALGTVRGEQLIEVDGVPDARRRALLERYASPMIAEWIAEQDDGAPFFLFLHTYVVHNYAPDRRRIEQHRLLDPFGNERRLVKDDLNRFNNGERFLRRGVIDQYVPYYDATIAMADDFVGEVLDALAGAGLDGDTLVIVTSDHGEEFGEHGYFGHGQTLFDTNARVPLIVRLPAGAPDAGPAVHDGLVSLVDLAPWILRLVGLAPDPRMAVGPPLGPEQEAPPARSRVFLDLDTRFHRVQAVREGDWKLHVRHAGDAFGEHTALVRLYDLDADPAERRDLGGGSETGRTLRELLDEFTRHAEALGAQGAAEDEAVDPLDDDVLESLRQLGYVDTHGPDAPAGDR
jgi:arylsulfatase A-like enzyme